MTATKPILKLKSTGCGMYSDHANSMGVNHELVWSKSAGRKWIAYYHVSPFGAFRPERREEKFDTLAEARDFLKSILAKFN